MHLIRLFEKKERKKAFSLLEFYQWTDNKISNKEFPISKIMRYMIGTNLLKIAYCKSIIINHKHGRTLEYYQLNKS